MNKTRIIQFLALTLVGNFTLQADEGVLTKAMSNTSAGTVDAQAVRKSNTFKDPQTTAPLQGIEFRIGPIYNTETNIDIQTGPRGQAFDLEKLGLDDPNLGVKADLDWEVGPRLHFNNSLTWIHFNQVGNLQGDVTYGTGMKLLSGSRVDTELDILKYEPKIGYDVVKLEDFRVMPYFGGIGAVAHGNVSAKTGGFVEREQGKISRIDREKAFTETHYFGTYLVGFELQYRFTKSFYTGCDFGGYYMGFLNGAVGKGYLAYDFTEKFSLRLGCDADWVSYDDSKLTVEGYTTTPYLQMGMKF